MKTTPEIAALVEESHAREADFRDALARGLDTRIRMSVHRRTPFLSDQATKELAEAIIENVSAFLKGAFDL